jgi:hypothetical protein
VFSHRTISAAAAIAVLGTPLAASAQQTAYSVSPVAVAACNISSASHSIGVPSFASFDVSEHYLNVNFVNNGKVPATNVTFVIDDGSSPAQIVDRGSFTPGVQIAHQIREAYASNEGPAKCSVADVQFADGTSWHAANVNVAKAAR